MTRPVGSGLMLALSPIVLAVVGCGDKAAMDALTQDRQRLTGELENCRDELEAARQGRESCEQQLANLMRENQSLMAQLQQKPDTSPEPPGWISVPGGSMIALEGDVLFGSGKAHLREEAKPVLQAIARTIKERYGDRDVLVYGHTDNQPIQKSGWKDNYELSAQRSLTVVRFLASQGIAPARLVACGCGEHRPRDNNTSDSGRQKNRRVEVYALDAGSTSANR